MPIIIPRMPSAEAGAVSKRGAAEFVMDTSVPSVFTEGNPVFTL